MQPATDPQQSDESAPSVNLPTDAPELRQAIADAASRIRELRADRTEINAAIQEQLEALVSRGIPKDALKRAIADCDADEDKRDACDVAYQLCRAALGKPTQIDAFATTH